MIFSVLESPALHNKTKQIAGKELKIHYYYILCWRLGPWGPEEGRWGGVASLRDNYVWVTSTISWGRATLGSWRRRRSGVEGLGGVVEGGGWLLGTTYFKSRAVPYHPLFSCPHPTPPPLAPGSTQKCGCLCHCNLALFAKRFHCLLCAIGACMNRSQQDAGWHHSGSGVGVEKLHLPFSRGPLSSFILARLNPGLSNAWANSGG